MKVNIRVALLGSDLPCSVIQTDRKLRAAGAVWFQAMAITVQTQEIDSGCRDTRRHWSMGCYR